MSFFLKQLSNCADLSDAAALSQFVLHRHSQLCCFRILTMMLNLAKMMLQLLTFNTLV